MVTIYLPPSVAQENRLGVDQVSAYSLAGLPGAKRRICREAGRPVPTPQNGLLCLPIFHPWLLHVGVVAVLGALY